MSIKHYKYMALGLFLLVHPVVAENKSDVILQGKPVTVAYPVVPSDPVYMERSRYFGELLELILRKTGHPFKLMGVPVPPVPSSRTVMMMREGRYDVSWVHTSPEREEIMRAIRIPIYRGLGGWRLLFIRPQDTHKFSKVHTLDGLRKFTAGQGHDWPDIEILRNNGLVVRTAISRDSVFQLLGHSRIDYFPRGINEVWDEINLEQAGGFDVEKHLVIRYPTAFYLFVNKEEEALAKLLERGFEMAIADGSFNEHFMSHVGATIKRANLAKRTIIELANPTLSASTPLNRKELWFHSNELK